MPENDEDVSFSVVSGSVGTAGPVVTPWTARRAGRHDAARAACMPIIQAALSKFKATRPRLQRTPVDSDALVQARARVLSGRGW